jgi:Trypsin-like peptidase domain
MILRKISSLSFASSSIPCTELVQENPGPRSSTPSGAPYHRPNGKVVPIADVKFIGSALKAAFGAGFPLALQCGLIGTDRRLVETTHQQKIKDQQVVERYFAAVPDAGSISRQRSLRRGRCVAKQRHLPVRGDERIGAQFWSKGGAQTKVTRWKIILICVACASLADAATAKQTAPAGVSAVTPAADKQVQDFSQTVIPIGKLNAHLQPHLRIGSSFVPGIPPGIDPGLQAGAQLGTAFCLDPRCRLLGTNYHVAASARLRKINGQKIIRQYLATGPQDHDATSNPVAGVPMAFAGSRDLAILELGEPLPHHHGLTFSLDELEHGERVDIYGYPWEGYFRHRKLLRFPATFRGKTASGILIFDYQLDHGKALRGGASGGIVVDSKSGQIVGILARAGNAIGLEAQAVPVQSLAEFVRKVQPFLAHEIFRSSESVSPLPGDIYSKYAPSADFYSKFVPAYHQGLQHRPAEPEEVALLRTKAQALLDSMQNFIAVQSLAWGSGNQEPSAQTEFEIRVVDHVQRYRWYPDGKKESEEIPRPPLRHWVVPGNDWSELPMMIGTELQLRVHQAQGVDLNKHPMKVFQYDASLEDQACRFARLNDYGFFAHRQERVVSCYGEVWTDEKTNILRISQTMELPRQWGSYQVVVTYGWLNRAHEPPRLIPVTFYSQLRSPKRVDWCRGQFTDYHEFTVKAKLRPFE